MTTPKKSRICLQCLSSVKSLLTCSRCQSAHYCNSDCQRQHWPIHKKNCTPINDEDSDEKVLAMKSISYYNQGNNYMNSIIF